MIKKSRDQVFIIEKLQFFLVWGMLFLIPISTSTLTFLAGLLILVWLWERGFLDKWAYLKNEPLFWVWIGYVLLYPISLVWSDNKEWGGWIIDRHLYLLIFPIVLTSIKKEWLSSLMIAFAFGMTFSEFTSYLVWFEVIELNGVPPSNPVPFVMSHIVYNPLLAWALYILISLVLFEKKPMLIKVFALIFILTMTVNMFITGGRGGQIAYFLIILILFLQFYYERKKLFKGFLVAAFILTSVFTIAYNTSPLFYDRINGAYSDLKLYPEFKNTSLGTRLYFYENAIKMSFEKPFLGSGIGDTISDYNGFIIGHENIKMYYDRSMHFQPHNQFLYELVAFGYLGLLLFLSIFYLFFLKAIGVNDQYKNYRVAFLIFMIVALMPDALLFHAEFIYLFAVFSGVLFADFKKNKKTEG